MQQSGEHTIVLYSHDECIDCKIIERWFNNHGFAYTRRDVRKDPTALEELTALGFRSTPVTVIDGHVVDGLEMKQIRRLLTSEQ